MKSPHLQPLLGSLFVAFLVLFSAYNLQQRAIEDHNIQAQSIMEKRLSEAAAALSQSMNLRLNLTNSLAAFVTTNRNFTQQEFDRFASMLQNDLKGVRSLQLAPDGVVAYLTNLNNNRNALGHDLFADENRRPQVEESVRKRSYIIAGPINLIQGGQAIIARRPLFFVKDGEPTDSFWGFATVLVDITPLLADANFASLEQDFTLGIRGKDGLGAKGDVFYGTPSIFENPLAIVDVILPDARWQLAAMEKPHPLPKEILLSKWYWVIVVLSAIILAGVSYSIINQPRVLRGQIHRATESLRTTLNSIGDAVIATDTSGGITIINPIAEKLTGWNSIDAIGKPLTDVFQIINAKTREQAINPVNTVFEDGEIVDLANHTVLIAKGGTEYQISDSAAPIWDDNNDMTGVVLVFRDVSEDYAIREKLHESEERQRELLNNTTSVIYIKDKDGQYQFINQKFEKLFKISNDVIVGKTDHDLFPSEKADIFYANDQRALASDTPIEFEEIVPHDDGNHTYISVKFPLRHVSGKVYAICGISTDITARKKAEDQLKIAKNEAEAANKAKSTFLASMSHDLRTPLNAIIGFSGMMQAKTFGSLGDIHYEQYADDIHSSGSLLISLINDVLDLSKIEAGKYELAEETLDVFSLIQASIRQLKNMADTNNHTLSFNAPSDIPALLGDERAMIQMLNNLLSNAIKFTPDRGEIGIGAKVDQSNRIVISISDNGIGMSDEGIARAMKPFEQADETHSRRHEGTGLGLHLCTNLMKLFGGTLDIESGVEIGTTVTLRFPPERTIRPL